MVYYSYDAIFYCITESLENEETTEPICKQTDMNLK